MNAKKSADRDRFAVLALPRIRRDDLFNQTVNKLQPRLLVAVTNVRSIGGSFSSVAVNKRVFALNV